MHRALQALLVTHCPNFGRSVLRSSDWPWTENRGILRLNGIKQPLKLSEEDPLLYPAAMVRSTRAIIIFAITTVGLVSATNVCASTTRGCSPTNPYACCSNIASNGCCTFPKNYGWSTSFTDMPPGSWGIPMGTHAALRQVELVPPVAKHVRLLQISCRLRKILC